MSELESQSTEPKKRGPKPKESVSIDQYNELLNRVEKLEACLSKVATDAGQGNVLSLFGLSRVNPTKSEMKRYG